MRIIGFDPGLRHTGWGVVDMDGVHLRFVECGSVDPPDSLPMADRLKELGFSIGIHPALGFLAMGAALQKAYADLKANGETTDAIDLYDFGKFNDLVGFPAVWEFEKKYAQV